MVIPLRRRVLTNMLKNFGRGAHGPPKTALDAHRRRVNSTAVLSNKRAQG